MKRCAGVAVRMLIVTLALFTALPVRSQTTTGSISGTVKDPEGAVIPDIAVIAKDTATGVQQNAVTNTQGLYAFPTVPVGTYELDTFRPGFKPYRRTGLVIDINTALQIDITLEVGAQSEQVTVNENAVQVDTESSQMGDVITGAVMTEVGLNGRSYTDLLALQPGIVPMSTQTPDSVVMAGVSVAITPSGNLNPGNQSINGQREDANGFLVNGSDVKEEMNGGTAIIPDLDSISEFRVLTNNFDAEYGNYAGGIVTAVTKGGTNQIHGSAFEFLRNTDLDAKAFFSPSRDAYRQNQFGGTIGGPIKKNKVFYFGDYQGTRTVEGLDTGDIAVPSLGERQGNFSDATVYPSAQNPAGNNPLPGTVPTQYLANTLSQELGHTVSPNEPFWNFGCTSTAACVFPAATATSGPIIPKSVWQVPSQNLLQYIPLPNAGPTTFAGAENETLRDDKASGRIDENTERWGDLSAYYFFDDYIVDNPFPSGQGGATVPGFNGINHGRAQLISLGDTKTFGTETVNEAHFSFTRSDNVVGQPQGGLGISLASQGFNTNPATGGILPLAPQIEGIANIVFNNQFVMGEPITNLAQANNTFTMNESLSRVLSKHTVKAGIEFSSEQVNVNPDATFNGTFTFDGYVTGNNFADYLLGAPNQFTQSDSASYYPRHKYVGWYGQDSWRIKPNLTFNYGLRVELMQYWSEKYDQVPTFNPGEQSVVYPNAFPGLVYPTDPGIPNTLVPQRFRYAPRVGLAYSPSASSGLLGKVFGRPGSTSIRAGYGIMNTVIEGNTIGVDEPQPPYGLSDTVYNGTFASPYNLLNGTQNASPYPITFPPLNANASHPNSSVIFDNLYNPQSGMTAPPPWNTYPYSEDYFLSFERQLPGQTVLSISYVGTEGHHLLAVYSADPGNPALCMALNAPGVLTAGESCGPGGENNTYNLASAFTFNGIRYPAGSVLQGTRVGLNTSLINNNVQSGNYYGNDSYDASIGNSDYNALQISVKNSPSHGLTYTLGYTYSKSIDQASSLSDALDPYNFNATRGLSAWNLNSVFVATYDYRLPLDRLSHRARRVLEGWEISGVTRASTGFPVTLSTLIGDNSLQGSSPNGVNNRYVDMPDLTGEPLDISNPHKDGLQYFNPGAFAINALGTVGDAGHRTFSGPGMFNTDAVLVRNFQIRETQVLQFRAEFFNIFNHTQFFGPAAVNGVEGSPLFGQVVNAEPPRLVQLALKYNF